MPFYEYECSACKFYVEALQKLSDSPLQKCPSCGKQTMQRLISAPVFRLKGAGWYETDFKSEQENKRNLAEDKDKEPAAPAADSDDKKIKARASKVVRKATGKSVGKTVTKPVAGKSRKTSKLVKKSVPKPARKKPAAKKPVAKKPATKKPVTKKTFAKKKPAATKKTARKKK